MDKETARRTFLSPGGAPPSEDADSRNVSFLQVPEPASRAVRFQDEHHHDFRRSGRRKSISMPTELNLLLEFAEFSCVSRVIALNCELPFIKVAYACLPCWAKPK